MSQSKLILAFLFWLLKLIKVTDTIGVSFSPSEIPPCYATSRLQGPLHYRAPSSTQRYVVIGDIHGAYKGFLEVCT